MYTGAHAVSQFTSLSVLTIYIQHIFSPYLQRGHLVFEDCFIKIFASSGHPNAWMVYCLCQSSSNNTYINPSYKDLMKFVPGTFRWLMYLSPFTLPQTFGHNKLCNSCLHRYSACPSPHCHGHVFMFFRLDRPVVSILFLQNIITCPEHSCTTCLESYPQNITLSDGNKYNHFTSLLYKQIGLIPTFTV